MLELFYKIIRYSLIIVPFFHINLNDSLVLDYNDYDYDYELTEIKVIKVINEPNMSWIEPTNTSMIAMNEHSPLYTNPTLGLFFIFMVNLFYMAME